MNVKIEHKLDKTQLIHLAKKIGRVYVRYNLVIILLVAGFSIGLSLNRANSYEQTGSSVPAYEEDLPQPLTRINIDQQTQDALQDLNSTDIIINPDLPDGRINPFE